ncbi:OmpA family protein [Sphingopyxis sp.]|uniref:OmpA family protein n=1 Tax=Sphingopyxis sp. TaxID=1908224 RepID=UPI0025E04061|nr:OmpA family protein [Sphingopyxis sp.]MBK6411815.1 OmpA family protein [Sphingopyxis sp.]
MTQTMLQSVKSLLLVLGASLLAACQSVPPQVGFSPQQIAVLKAEGFVDKRFDWTLNMPERLLFSTNESRVSTEQLDYVAGMAERLLAVGITTARVEGHTDSMGTAAYNLTLSQARAAAVAVPMQASGMQITADQIVGRGEAVPMSSNDTDEGRQDNRRVVVIVTPR